MDTRAAFGFGLIALGLGGLFAVATGRLSIKDGQIVIGQPASSTADAGAGVAAPNSGSFGTYSDPTSVSGVPAPQQISLQSVLASTPSGDAISSIYSPSSFALVSSIAGDGAAMNPFGIGAAA